MRPDQGGWNPIVTTRAFGDADRRERDEKLNRRPACRSSPISS